MTQRTLRWRRLFAVVLAAISVVGGHYLNRRPDRAQFFLALFLAWPALLWLTLSVMFQPGSGSISGWIMLSLLLPVLAWVATWFASLIVTYRDSAAGHDPSPVFSKLAVFSATVLSGVCFLFMFVATGFATMLHPLMLHAFPSIVSSARSVSSPETPAYVERENFWQYLHFGGEPRGMGKLAPPPAGEGWLVGQFVFDDKPAADVTLYLTLNGEYESEALTTDAAGRFTLRLPVGEWYLNRLRTTGWKEKPKQGNFVLISGQEPKLGSTPYSVRSVTHGDRGFLINVTPDPPATPRTFTIRREVELQWPTAADTGVATTVKDATIRWTPYPNAKKYLVTLSDTERQPDGGAMFRPVVYRRVSDGAQLALSELKFAHQDGKPKEYTVTIAAFSEDGTLLSQISSPGRASFVLSDNNVLLDERLSQLEVSERDMSEIFDNRPRLNAVETLIKENMLPEAEKLLANIKGATEPGRKAALKGFLLARHGRCKEAEQLFAQARAAGEACCIVEAYRQGCNR